MEIKYSAPAVSKMLDIIEILSKYPECLSINELARITNNSVNSVYRICIELEKRDYLQKDTASGRYQLGVGFYFIGQASINKSDLRNTALPIMKRLRDVTEETVHLTVLRDSNMLLLEQIETLNPIKIHVDVGSALYPHASAFGKCLLAFVGEEVENDYLKGKLKQLTTHTITDVQSMKAELMQIRKEYMSFDREEYLEGVACIGAPVFDLNGNCVASVGIIFPKYRVSREKHEKAKVAVSQSALEISLKMGYRANGNL